MLCISQIFNYWLIFESILVDGIWEAMKGEVLNRSLYWNFQSIPESSESNSLSSRRLRFKNTTTTAGIFFIISQCFCWVLGVFGLVPKRSVLISILSSYGGKTGIRTAGQGMMLFHYNTIPKTYTFTNIDYIELFDIFNFRTVGTVNLLKILNFWM